MTETLELYYKDADGRYHKLGTAAVVSDGDVIDFAFDSTVEHELLPRLVGTSLYGIVNGYWHGGGK